MIRTHMGVGEGWQQAGWMDDANPPPGSAVFTGAHIMALAHSGYDVYFENRGRVFTRKPGDGVFEPGLTSTENASKKV